MLNLFLQMAIYLFAAGLLWLVTVRLGRKMPARIFVFLVCLPVCFLFPAFVSSRSAMPADLALNIVPWTHATAAPVHNYMLGDIVTQMMPWNQAVRLAYREGSMPWRDRWNGCGMPLAANGQSAPFSPFLLLTLPLPIAQAFTVMAAMKFLVALTGMWLWLVEMKVSRASALVGAIGFAFSLAMMTFLYFPHTSVLCWAPWCLLGIELLGGAGSFWRGEILLLAVLSLWPLCGHPETAASLAAFTAFWLAARMFSDDSWTRKRKLAGLGMAVVGSLGLTAFSLLPQLHAISRSNRAFLNSVSLWSPAFSFTPRLPIWPAGFLTPFFPRMFGDSLGTPYVPGIPGNFVEVAQGYCGLIVWAACLLIVLPAGKRRSHAELALLLPMAIGWLVAAGAWPLAEIAGSIPLYKMMMPFRGLTWLTIGAPAVAAFEIDRHFSGMEGHGVAVRWRRLLIPGALAAAAIGVWLRMKPAYDAIRITGSESRATVLALLALALFSAIILVFRNRRARVLGPVLALAAAAELMAQGRRLYRYSPVDSLFRSTPLVEFLKSQPAPFRVAATGLELYPSTNVFAGVEDVRTQDPIEPRAYVEFLDRCCGFPPAEYYKTIHDVNSPVLDLLNVRFVLSGPGQASPGPKWRLVYSGSDGTVFENVSVKPRIFSPSAESALTIADYRETTNRVSFSARVAQATPLSAVASLYTDGGWSAQIDGAPLRLESAKDLFLKMTIPPGLHRVTLGYEPPGFRIGLWISIFSAGSIVLLGVAIRRKREKQVRSRAL